MTLMTDPRLIEYRTARREVRKGLKADIGSRERYRDAVRGYIEAHAQEIDRLLAEKRTHPRMREFMMRAMFEDGLPLGAIAIGFKATEAEIEYVSEHPPVRNEPVDELDRLRQLPYGAYLRTQHWQAVRKDALERAEGRCMLCNSAQNLEVHHRSYDRRGCERPADVVVLCDSCHSRHHGKRRAA